MESINVEGAELHLQSGLTLLSQNIFLYIFHLILSFTQTLAPTQNETQQTSRKNDDENLFVFSGHQKCDFELLFLQQLEH